MTTDPDDEFKTIEDVPALVAVAGALAKDTEKSVSGETHLEGAIRLYEQALRVIDSELEAHPNNKDAMKKKGDVHCLAGTCVINLTRTTARALQIEALHKEPAELRKANSEARRITREGFQNALGHFTQAASAYETAGDESDRRKCSSLQSFMREGIQTSRG